VGRDPNSRICAGSPGIRCRIKNTSTVTPNNTGAAMATRRARRRSTWVPYMLAAWKSGNAFTVNAIPFNADVPTNRPLEL
jgi:hypothetical protein